MLWKILYNFKVQHGVASYSHFTKMCCVPSEKNTEQDSLLFQRDELYGEAQYLFKQILSLLF